MDTDQSVAPSVSRPPSHAFTRAAADDQGLYRSSDEHDSCGVGFVADIKGRRTHAIIRQAIDLLINLEHRGACGADPNTGDGAGILVQMPDRFFRERLAFPLPPAGAYGAGLVFLPADPAVGTQLRDLVTRIAAEEGQYVLGWRPVPTNLRAIGKTAASAAPVFEHVFVGRNRDWDGPDAVRPLRTQALRHSQAHRAGDRRAGDPR